MEKKIKVLTGLSEKASINADEMTIVHYISTNTRDRYNEVMVPEGMDKSNYEKNPVVLFAHDAYQLPIGRALWVKQDDTKTGIIAKTQFDKRSEVSAEIFRLFAEGYLNAWSIGFKYKEPPELIGDTWYAKSWELLEYSAVPVPANPDALILALKSIKTEVVKEAFIGTKEYQMKQIEDFEKIKTELKEIREMMSNSDKDYKKSLNELESKTAKKLLNITKFINSLRHQADQA